ncbi:winged helix-turn-helix transcriptional regulator [Halorussus gelatinilyticus]|uniref:Winged helix-turn-helix transcriptional regulator n=1 Tax=Halorussus gelatinilyticus TaxID=2937524 RepID=A0A8U0IGX5_9EURY|nr:helix-turn-helix domain-containing protein [Halorussus gelatinilyticus]UPW00128.1 winged helix-turn-helix transcriptional regulator [Halorussus gelatinilyticus]
MSASETARTKESRLTGENATEAIRDLPPSAKLVAKVLEYNDTLTQSQIAEESLLPDRTVRYALNRLDDEDIVSSRFSFSDARKRLYSLDLD